MLRRGGRQTFFATCAPGSEAVLHDEVRALGFGRAERQVGGVLFGGTMRDAMRANLWLRTAVRVLWRLARFPASDGDELYRGVHALPWTELMPASGTLWVDAQGQGKGLTHSRFVAQRTKDAIVDHLRERCGERPSVVRDDPDVRIHVLVGRGVVTVSLDASGDSLHKRGWRRHQGLAPLAETLAATLVQLSGWDRRAPLIDPFCGSGTVLIEAALWAGHVAPGLFRSSFGCERWPGHDAAAFARLREEAAAAATWPPKLVLQGGDRDARRIAEARDNAAAAGVEERIALSAGDALALRPRPGWNAWIVTNPPYGERIGDRAAAKGLWRAFGAVLRERCHGYHVAVLADEPALLDALAVGGDRVELVHGGRRCAVLRGTLPA